ncbi:MAG: hypothetical protein K6357_05875 [Elusimicrobiota bacterium]
MIKRIFENTAFWLCLVGIIIARIIHKKYGNSIPEYIDFLVTSLLPSFGILIGIYIEKKRRKQIT